MRFLGLGCCRWLCESWSRNPKIQVSLIYGSVTAGRCSLQLTPLHNLERELKKSVLRRFNSLQPEKLDFKGRQGALQNVVELRNP